MKSADDMATDVLARWLQTSNLENSMTILADAFRVYGDDVKEALIELAIKHSCGRNPKTCNCTSEIAREIRQLKLP